MLESAEGQRRTIRVFQCPIAAMPKPYRLSFSPSACPFYRRKLFALTSSARACNRDRLSQARLARCPRRKLAWFCSAPLAGLMWVLKPAMVSTTALVRAQCSAKPQAIARAIVAQKFRHYQATNRMTAAQFRAFDLRLKAARSVEAVRGCEAVGSSLAWVPWEGLTISANRPNPPAMACASVHTAFQRHRYERRATCDGCDQRHAESCLCEGGRARWGRRWRPSVLCAFVQTHNNFHIRYESMVGLSCFRLLESVCLAALALAPAKPRFGRSARCSLARLHSNDGVDGPDGIDCARMRSLQISDNGDRPWNRLAELAWTRRSIFSSSME